MSILNRARNFAPSTAPRASKARRRRARGFRPEASLLEGRQLLSAVFAVTNDSGSATDTGSLPWAVAQANANDSGVSFINFDIPGDGPHVIDVTAPLELNSQTVINATTQPGYADGKPMVTVDGGGATATLFQLGQGSSGSTVQGLAMVGFTTSGVAIANGSQGNWILQNNIGFATDASGAVTLNSSATTQQATGVSIQSSFNTVWSNTISGVQNGVVIGDTSGGDDASDDDASGDDASGDNSSGTQYKTNSIQMNNIGTDPMGMTTTGFGNAADGILLAAGASENFIGPGNVLSGNEGAGLEMTDASNQGNVVFTNMIGLDRQAMAAIPNGGFGVLLTGGATGNAIGGPFGGNYVAANPSGGIALGQSGLGAANANWVQGNLVGLDVGQAAVVGAQNLGITVWGSSSNTVTGNVVGGIDGDGLLLTQATGNNVGGNWLGQSTGGAAFANAGSGVALLDHSTGNWIHANMFGSNTQGNVFTDQTSTNNVIGRGQQA